MTKSTGKRIVSTRGASLKDRLMLHAKREGDCLLWTGAKERNGYGKINLDGKYIPAHRAAWIAFKGEDPGKLFVCHRCDVRACIETEHLFLGEHRDNMEDMLSKERQARGAELPQAKLTEEQVKEIRASKESTRLAGLRYGVSRMTISLVRRKATWSHVKETP